MALMSVARPRVSYLDLQRAPEGGRRYEIYDGEVFVIPAPLPLHQIVALNLYDIFRGWVQRHGGVVLAAPIDIMLSDYDVVQPDVVFFSPARQHWVQLREPIRAAPDITVEVLSPPTVVTDRGRKMQLLARYGAPEYWLVDPDPAIVEVYHLRRGAYVLASLAAGGASVYSAELTGLECAADLIFRTNLCKAPAR